MGIFELAEKMEKAASREGFKFGVRDERINIVYKLNGIINNPCEEIEDCEDCKYCDQENCKSALAMEYIDALYESKKTELSEDDLRKLGIK